MTTRTIYCCACQADVPARLTDGQEIYPHRPDLFDLPFWKCDTCGNYVGCNHKTQNRTKPLGCIPTKEIKEARQKIHALLDPLWKQGRMSRSEVYLFLTKEMGKEEYHTAEIRSVEEAQRVLQIIKDLEDRISSR